MHLCEHAQAEHKGRSGFLEGHHPSENLNANSFT